VYKNGVARYFDIVEVYYSPEIAIAASPNNLFTDFTEDRTETDWWHKRLLKLGVPHLYCKVSRGIQGDVSGLRKHESYGIFSWSGNLCSKELQHPKENSRPSPYDPTLTVNFNNFFT
jgi:hypothetical protein